MVIDMALRGILLDIEGTIIPVAFVKDILFPYAKKHMASFLAEHQTDEAVCRWAGECQETIAHESGTRPSYDKLADLLNEWIENDRKHQGLKALQGRLWEEGYRTGVFVPKLYDDVAPSLRRWRLAGLQLGVYSSGSVEAQRLLLAHTTEGNLTSLCSDFFDTGMGSKREPASYRRIAACLGLHSEETLFLSDVELELDAATAAGLQAIHVVRPGTTPSTRHPTCATFDDVCKTDLLVAPLSA